MISIIFLLISSMMGLTASFWFSEEAVSTPLTPIISYGLITTFVAGLGIGSLLKGGRK